jgi:hypothetical protein
MNTTTIQATLRKAHEMWPDAPSVTVEDLHCDLCQDVHPMVVVHGVETPKSEYCLCPSHAGQLVQGDHVPTKADPQR